MSNYSTETKKLAESRSKNKFYEPAMYRVLLHNDNYTTMEFVVGVLISVFYKSSEDAAKIMLNVHHQGIGVCGIYTYDVADTKIKKVEKMARKKDFPLKCTMEKD